MTSQNPYPPDTLGEWDEDDGTMPGNVATLGEHVIGHRIVAAEKRDFNGRATYWGTDHGLVLTLDNGTRVCLADTSDCCAYTDLKEFLLHPERVDHVITGVATTEGFTKWHIFADLGDVLELTVGWSCGNPFYYGYGFDIFVEPDSAGGTSCPPH
ncbi:DUF7448 domain-containing protein [Nocardia sp. NPDC003963]